MKYRESYQVTFYIRKEIWAQRYRPVRLSWLM